MELAGVLKYNPRYLQAVIPATIGMITLRYGCLRGGLLRVMKISTPLLHVTTIPPHRLSTSCIV